ncbi:MAG: TraR/DksA C4-type zinc finger protein [Candidatus Pacebacteria bacterium]|nr:TraR/DksA C4-type zinc finger protein [Candidatus Paceibacterota bacterium]
MAQKNLIQFPLQILKPIKNFLTREESRLRKTKADLTKEDPFTDVARVADNAAVDTDAAEQESHARVSAIKKEIDRRLIQIRQALTRLKLGKYGNCEKCGRMISTDRLMVRPEATTCINCEKKKNQ